MDKKKVTSCDICLYYYYDYDYGDYMCQLDAIHSQTVVQHHL